jgi:hypothetical protein
MVYRKLLLPLSETPCGASALATGLAVAALWQAHLAALIVQVDSRDVAPLAGEGLSGAMIEDMMQATERDGAARAARLRALFEAAVAGAAGGVAGTTMQTVRGRDEEVVPAQARLADLTILPHPDRSQDEGASDTLHAVLFDSGRPVLIAPRHPVRQIGTRCCVAWNGTVESSSALAAMLPWLRRYRSVSGAARHRCRGYGVRPGESRCRRRIAGGFCRFRRRPARHGCLFPFPPAPVDSGRRDSACAA